MSEKVKKKRGFKEYNEVFWFNDKLKSGTRYQCKGCGVVTIGFFGDLDKGEGNMKMHETWCKYGEDQSNEEAAKAVEAEVEAETAETKTLEWDDRMAGISRIRLGRFVLTVHHCVGCGTQYFATCHHGAFSQVPLDVMADLEAAKAEAIDLFKDMLNGAARDLGMEVK